MTSRQVEVLAEVRTTNALGRWHRATCHGDRPVLVNLLRKRFLERRTFRGRDGEADAAYEYKILGWSQDLAASVYQASTRRT